ncbi:MAG: RNA pyrophosphohydrolase [Pararhodobacter sp.]|nr:RNA pyrophosphohydrolase [Pararhodobacter sp.]
MSPEDIAALPYRPCVGVMLINRDGLIFAGQRIDTAAPAWQMPQGGIDPGEDPRAAALRELGEEIGVTPDLVEVIAETPQPLAYELPLEMVPKIWKGRYRGQEQRWYLMRFKGNDAQIDLAQPHPEFSQWRWIAADDMLAAIVPFKRAIYAQVIEAFRKHLA